ncbi:o-succinylbenzoate--CoA ligase [Martelella alba]|uniref:O-succinylbenzoate--CoA ligase n=1 Tax=Martelella alba TaxID=2590451 RepID=A0ABY2SKN2_9HYPH|nr:o-succinylbenzoate--CoA ligase [Martelella alba]TKI04781.1 o-succinylbenzoate--CoA ligase [Martelella alba]
MTCFDDWPWRHWAHVAPDRIALRTAAADWSWRQLAAHVDRLAAQWRASGVVEGAGVALRGKNRLELVLAYLAALQCGARVAPLSPQWPAELLARRLPGLNMDFGWCANGESWPTGVRPLSMGVSAPLSGYGTLVPWRADRLATLTLTSGSTGLPKAAAHTFAAHLASAAAIVALMGFGQQHGWLLSLPLSHVSGQGIVWRWLTAGAALVLADDRPLAQALAGCTHASLVPTQLWRLLAGDTAGFRLRDVLLGGAMIPTDLTQQAEARGVRCWCGYGMTEFASTVCAKRADASPGVGTLLPGREWRLVEGEVWLRGNSMAVGYWQDGGILPLADRDGWFHTRDRGRIRDGELYIAGRLDNLFTCGGESVQPEDIERILAAHPAVRQAFVVPVPDAEFGHRPVAVLDADIPFEGLGQWLNPQLAPWQRPIAYYRLPDSFGGGGIKIPRGRLAAWVAAQFSIKP